MSQDEEKGKNVPFLIIRILSDYFFLLWYCLPKSIIVPMILLSYVKQVEIRPEVQWSKTTYTLKQECLTWLIMSYLMIWQFVYTSTMKFHMPYVQYNLILYEKRVQFLKYIIPFGISLLPITVTCGFWLCPHHQLFSGSPIPHPQSWDEQSPACRQEVTLQSFLLTFILWEDAQLIFFTALPWTPRPDFSFSSECWSPSSPGLLNIFPQHSLP